MENVYRAASPYPREKLIERLISLPYPSSYPTPHSDAAFGDLFSLWARFAVEEIRKRAGSRFDILSPKAEKRIIDKFVKELSTRCGPTFAAFLHLAKLDGKLHGGSSRANYFYYLEKIFPDPKYQREAYGHFPPLARTIATILLLGIDQTVELLERLHRDCKEIESTFSPGRPLGRVADLSPSLSDLHHGNRSVYRIEFENGVQLIYKPKPLALDAAYNRFIEKLALGLKAYKIIDRTDYGWVEFIETLPCESAEELKRFFERFGMLICLMYLLEGTDCHYENMLACGEHPVLIDLESLFHPTVKQTKPLPDLAIWNESVFRTGFLPSFGLAAQRRMDISPLSAEEEQDLPRTVAQWQKINTDEMEFAFVKKKISISIPRPKYKGKTVPTTPFIPELLRGFEAMYRRFLSGNNEILSWLEDLFCHPVRCIFRPTELYFQILQRLTDPKLMRSEEESAKTLEVLTRFSIVKESPHLPKIAEKEKEALLHGDIPFFLSSPSDADLYLGREKVAPGFFRSAAKEKVIEKIRPLNESDLRIQLEYIDHSLYFLKMNDNPKQYRYLPFDEKQHTAPINDKQLIDCAERIGEKILSMAQTLSDGSLAWICLEMDPVINRYIFQPISHYFYSGNAGIAFFLAALGKISRKPRFSQVAEQLLDRIKKGYREETEAMKLLLTIGAMSGIGGLIYAFSSLGKILERPPYLDEAEFLASLIEKKKIEEDATFDIISGSAGFILVLLALHEKRPSQHLLDLANFAGKKLLAQGKKTKHGIAWETMQGKSLCGFSHGAAGIAYSLYKLFEATKDKAFLEGAKDGYAYENSLYSPEHKNWPDLRSEDNFVSNSWCHGAPGIALARAFSQPIAGKETDLALQAILERFEGNIDHVCCGNFGRISILWSAGKALGREDLIKIARFETARLLKQYEERNTFRLYYDLPEEIQSPSFMQGLSGIGYALLRQTKLGEELPEVLALE